MPLDALEALGGIGLALVAVVALLSVATLVLSVRERRRDRRQREARRAVRAELFERLDRDDPQWEQWVATLSGPERTALEALVERYLRTVSGTDREPYLDLARALAMGERADVALSEDDIVEQLRAITRLTLLDYPVEVDRLLATTVGDQRTREATARLLYERREEFQQSAALSTGLLVWSGTQPMTARGMQTLYEHSDGSPEALLLLGWWSHDAWDERTLEQVCRVLERCQTTAGLEWFEWMFRLFAHDQPRVRGAAIRAFRQVGWQADVRERIPFRQLLADEPRVRRATYRVLADWGDEDARELLQWAVVDEDEPRTQMVAVRALAALESADPDETQPGWPGESWDWVRAEIAAAESRRLPSRGGVLQR